MCVQTYYVYYDSYLQFYLQDQTNFLLLSYFFSFPSSSWLSRLSWLLSVLSEKERELVMILTL